MAAKHEILDLRGVARHCGVSPDTPQQWRQRGILPAVDFPEIHHPLWLASTIKAWAIRTGRNFWDDPENRTYRDVFTEDEEAEAAEQEGVSDRGIPGLVFSAPS